MSQGLKKVWEAGDAWSPLAYQLFRDSREWRYLLALNRDFDIRSQPAPGVEIPVTGVVATSINQPRVSSTPGLLQQVDMNLDLTRPGPKKLPPTARESIYPWTDFQGYTERLGQYTSMAILTRDRTNGYTLDSAAARTTPLGYRSFETTD